MKYSKSKHFARPRTFAPLGLAGLCGAWLCSARLVPSMGNAGGDDAGTQIFYLMKRKCLSHMQRGRRDGARRKPKIAWQRQRMTPAVVSYYIQYDTKIVVLLLCCKGAWSMSRDRKRRELFCIIKANQSIARAVSVVLTTKTWSGNMWVSVYLYICMCVRVCLGVCSGILQGWIWILCLGTKVVQLWHSSCRFQVYLCFYFSL